MTLRKIHKDMIDESLLNGVNERIEELKNQTEQNKYIHPENHPASIIIQDSNNQFVSDNEKATWNSKANTTVASTTVNGLMSSADKTKLNGIATGATNTVIDNVLTSTSTSNALSAYQGKLLNDKVVNLETKTVKLDNIGQDTVTTSNNGTAFGLRTTAIGSYSHAEGDNTVATSIASHAKGRYTLSSIGTTYKVTSVDNNNKVLTLDRVSGLAVGNNININILDKMALLDVEISEINTTNLTIKLNTTSDIANAKHVILPSMGTNNIVASYAEGLNTLSSGTASHAEGRNTTASGIASHAEGDSTTASGISSHAEGSNTLARGGFSHAEGDFTEATGTSSHSEGTNTVASGNYSHAEGSSTTASGNYSHAEGSSTTASGIYSHAEGNTTTAGGSCSHAEGYNTTASGHYSHAEGSVTTASGENSHAEGYNTVASFYYAHAEGQSTTASGQSSHAEGANTTASGNYSHAGGAYTEASVYASTALGRYNKVMTGSATGINSTDDALVIGNGTSLSAKSNAFRVRYDGRAYGLSSFNSTGADYAEYFEWIDGNEENEDRVGYFVALDGEKIRKATSKDDYILGISSVNPSVVGDSWQDEWNEKYFRDEWGRVQYQYVDVPAQIESIPTDKVDDKGNIIFEEVEISPARQDYIPVLNPNWNSEEEYIPREERKEWSPIGMMGKLLVREDGTCKVNSYCKPNDDGIATASDDNTGFRVMKRVSENMVYVLIK